QKRPAALANPAGRMFTGPQMRRHHRLHGAGQDPHVLRAIARAWNWRRKIERGEASTIADIAGAEKVADRFVSRMMRLAYLAPDVLEKLLIQRIPPALSLNDLVVVAELPWAEQVEAVFGAASGSSP
ncbi:MAG TPA: hypothetical protein PKY73_18015, partial [Hyphomonas sp.]|nr:hypothetical protein [Hyphomonas sp.]